MTDRFRFTTIAHANHRLCSPIADDKLDRVVEALALPDGARVLEQCTGRGELLLRIATVYPTATTVGVDLNTTFVEDGQRAAAARGVADRVELRVADAWHLDDDGGWDLVVNIGGARKNDSQAETLAAMRTMARPGGLVLVGDGYWRTPPDPEYLDAFGWSADEQPDHAGNLALGVAAGLTPVYSCTSSVDEWDHYEGLYQGSMERWLHAHPDDPDAPAFAERIRKWRDGYQRWGRDTLGFGLYLYLV